MKKLGPATPSETHAAIARRAADFILRRRFWEWNESDQAELDAWLAESDFHQVTYLRVQGGAAHIEKLATLRPSDPGVPQQSGIRRRFVLPLLAAASIVLVATLGILFVRDLMRPPNRVFAARVFATNVGGQARLKFADGTEVELNTDTAVRYRMTTQERTIWLDKGEAYFRVAHNAADPFTVVVGGHRITDLGTEFLVRETGSLDVVLVKGRAQLASILSGAPVATLTSGDEAVATPASTTITKKTQQELADELAWRRGMLVFRNTRLADAVREFDRYNETKLIIADPSIASLKFSAELKTDDFEDFLQLAQTVLKLHVDREGNDILISRGQREETKRAVRNKHSE
jgi:transmembrane sensor